jgi:hypothetical protein
MALDYHNDQRAMRENTKLLKLDTAMAAFIQKSMNNNDFATKGKIENRGMYSECGQSVFKKEDDKTSKKSVEFSNLASEFWYSGNTDYNPDTGLAKTNSASNTDKMLKFTQMVWKNSSKVGFGVKNNMVIAWYCDAKGNVGGADDFKANVGARCDKDTYNKCYAERALKAHKLKRKYHEAHTPEIKLDIANSKELQLAMNANNYDGAAPSAKTDCSDSMFE